MTAGRHQAVGRRWERSIEMNLGEKCCMGINRFEEVCGKFQQWTLLIML
jgi:hypothetical protein